MIQNQLKLIPLTDIHVARDQRQRTTITPASIYDLALSIARNGLLQNIGVTTDKHEIVFGERRYQAFTLLSSASKAKEGHRIDSEGLNDEQLDQLQAVAQATPLYESWTKIPCRLIKGADKINQSALEFIENASREDLPWQDKATAAYSLHKNALAATKARNAERTEDTPLEYWRNTDTAQLLGISTAYFETLTSALRELESAGDKSASRIKDAIKKSPSALSAKNAAAAIKQRHSEPVNQKNKLQGKVLKPDKVAPQKPESEPESLPVPILNVDFHTWAAEYTGPSFNFIHCDFPYGINYNAGSNFNTNQANIQQGKYDDSEDVYWGLIETLAVHAPKLINTNAHLMFWFSPNMRDKTRKQLSTYFPEAKLWDWEMIWVNPTKQATPDPQRYGQRNYQTALLLTFGDRKIVKPKRLAFVHDEQATVHRSQKSLTVLSHFFEMFVDSSSRVLDPTCGSATSLIAANKLGAEHVLGLETDPTAHEQAVRYWRENHE